MYYDEQVINGVLCHRGTPDGQWIAFTSKELTAKIVELKAEVSSLECQIEDEIEMRGSEA